MQKVNKNNHCKKKANIAVLVSGGGTNLQALIDAGNKGELKSGHLKLVISSKQDAYALVRAHNAGIDAVTVSKKQCGGQEVFERRIEELLKEYSIDVIILAGFMSIFSAEFVKRYPNRIINIHPSLIPSFCGKGFYGLKVHKAALEYGVKLTGAAVHYVNEVTDGGEILLQKAVDVMPDDTPETLQRRVMEQGEWILLPMAAEMVCRRILEEDEYAFIR